MAAFNASRFLRKTRINCLDCWLKRLFPHLSQIRIEKMCRKGELRIDGARCKPATRIEAGQEVRIPHSAPNIEDGPSNLVFRIKITR